MAGDICQFFGKHKARRDAALQDSKVQRFKVEQKKATGKTVALLLSR